ncbi:hypothetical protein [Rhodovastum atsumiense]|uniref:Uncharacterized protein n=1 Tax=Rhodovastum atsumiense TaxID=504468 RepID=A0A5M6J3S2_9PROT|nr:hypothetical protein [Rhodovastum atsumiense]KAA5614305.1 hypothetical protein F1189_01540 [Rhodovastum atsumiense]
MTTDPLHLHLDLTDLADDQDGVALVAAEAALIFDCVRAELGATREAMGDLLHRRPARPVGSSP